ncbi:alpha/beta-hydrolase [Cutaneotrichosporon oleaginosum]|uniref:Alpha/beta-hydrolase n=1 Tax=Cutaneotrichosporon oleaginosum TaxID=879819 RepID=A0A0J0XP75_9TREE|nr:alpha/beta-hydrolase [Cutaneotrichosporon oleaginosum]KLT42910.1 alpha/beta-hydrolase [Cutaneotrichosporon oleaginosum]TXT12613.1 hypothetical protein COLE_03023 [Cutaneotrichosporon oleaginosum]
MANDSEPRAETPVAALAHPGASFLTDINHVTLPDGRTLQTYTAGKGDDVIVLESGMGTGGAYWGLVVDELVAHPVRVVAYDRAGYGGSSPATDARRVEDLANDLLALVATLDARRILLVGHSWGGPILRVAASKLDQSRLVGLLLVDPSDELCPFYFTRKMTFLLWLGTYLYIVYYYLGMLPKMARGMLDPLPEPYMSAALAGCTKAAARASSMEVANIGSKLRSCETADLSGVRVTLISAGGGEMGQEMRDALTAAHKQRVERVKGRFVHAEKSPHNVNVHEPALVASEAMMLLGQDWRAD